MLIKEPAQHLIQGGPAMTVIEMMTGKTLYPDFTQPRDIHDKLQYLARSVGLGQEYDALRKTPQKPGTWMTLAGVQTFPKGEGAWDDTRAAVHDFLRSKGKADAGLSGSEKSAALYNVKLAMRYHDLQMTQYWLVKYKEAGGTRDGLATSLKALDPLHGLNDAQREEFISTLTAEQRERAWDAYRYYGAVMAPNVDLETLSGTPYVRRIGRAQAKIEHAIDRQAATNAALKAGEAEQRVQQRQEKATVRGELTGAGLR
jgi:hypothetical protein